MRTMIIGGTSGLGLELARKLQAKGDEVIITGRKNPEVAGVTFQRFDLDQGLELSASVDAFVSALPTVDRVIYSAGFYQDGNITELSDEGIRKMLDVGLMGAVWFCKHLLKQQGNIGQFVAITSSSQYKPREKEIIYTAAKAGLAQFANSLSLDPRVGSVYVFAPEGMKTEFWRATGKETAGYNDPAWVSDQILEALSVQLEYAFIKILRNPARTEVVETR